MPTPDHFNLHKAIEQYIQEINCRELLRRDESDEIFDHLLSDSEELMADGLSEQEAFTMSVERFGVSELISIEYGKTRPLGSLKGQIVTGLMLFFTVLFITQLIHHLTIFTFSVGDHFHWTPQTGQLFDIGLKVLLLGGLMSYLVYRIKNQPYFRRLELWLIPLLGTGLPYILGRFWYLVHDPTGLYTYQKDMLDRMFINSQILSFLTIVLLVIIHFFRGVKDRRQQSSSSIRAQQPVFLMLTFYLLVLHAGIQLVGFLSFHSAQMMGLAEGSISNFDLGFKALFVGGLGLHLLQKLKKEKHFRTLEIWFLPLIALSMAALTKYTYTFFNMIDPAARKFFRIGIGNSSTIKVLALLLLVVLTFVIVAKEQRRLTKNFL